MNSIKTVVILSCIPAKLDDISVAKEEIETIKEDVNHN